MALLLPQLMRRSAAFSWSPIDMPSIEAAYDPRDPATLFQDNTGTVPVTTIGDPVGRISDITGNGHHLLQATAPARGLWTGTGILLDGVDDLYIEATPWSATLPLYMATAYRKDADASGASVEMFQTIGNSTQVLIFKSNQTGALARTQVSFRVGGLQTNVNTALGSWLNGQTHVIDALHVGGLCSAQIDNTAEVSVANADASNAAIITRRIAISRSTTVAALAGVWYGGIVSLADPGAERANAKQWLAARAGVSL
jgi:hypothetical protein